MTVDLQVTHMDAMNALNDKGIRQLLQLKLGEPDAVTGFRPMLPNITITPPLTTASPLRTITYFMGMLVSVSEEGSREKFRRVMGFLIRAAGNLGGMVATGSGLVPANAEAAVDIAVKTAGNIDDILDHTQADRSVSIDQLKVALNQRGGNPVKVKARLAIDAQWATDDPSDDDNKAWIEVEQLKIGSGADFRANPPRFDVDAWDPTESFPSGSHTGRSFLNSGGRRDRVGAMVTQNSSNPRAWLLEAEAAIDRDTTTVDALSTISVLTWDGTVVVDVKRIILELEADDSPTDIDTATEDTSRAMPNFEERREAGAPG